MLVCVRVGACVLRHVCVGVRVLPLWWVWPGQGLKLSEGVGLWFACRGK